MLTIAGPQQTDTWPLIWADLDPANLPSWVVWQRTCEHPGSDGAPCPRRMAGSFFNVRHCDLHCPPGASTSENRAIG